MTDSVGSRLRAARELRRLSLQQVSEVIKVRVHYLQALENDDYIAIPSAAQARGFLRNYAEFLELDLAGLVAPAEPLAAPQDSAPAAITPVTAAPSTGSGLLAGLRQRLGRRIAKDAVPEVAAETPVTDSPSAVPEQPPAAEASLEPAAPAPALASTEVKTARGRKSGSGDVKKNAAN